MIVTFKLIEPINIDELESVEYFEFERTSSIRGKRTAEKIGCILDAKILDAPASKKCVQNLAPKNSLSSPLHDSAQALLLCCGSTCFRQCKSLEIESVLSERYRYPFSHRLSDPEAM